MFCVTKAVEVRIYKMQWLKHQKLSGQVKYATLLLEPTILTLLPLVLGCLYFNICRQNSFDYLMIRHITPYR